MTQRRSPSRAGTIARAWACASLALSLGAPVWSQTGTVRGHQKISDTEGGFLPPLDTSGRFGLTVASLGDLDGDGFGDLIVGKEADNDGGVNRGACFVLFMNPDGTVASDQKLSATAGGFGGDLDNHDRFGASVAHLPELDSGAATSVAIGAIFDGDGGSGPASGRGAVWIVSLENDGTVFAEHKLSMLSGGFGGTLADGDWFGVSVSNMGDLDGDGPGATAIAVGALNDDDGGPDRGAVWILFLDAQGLVLSETKISATSGGFSGPLADDDHFGRKVASIADLDGDGIRELCVGAPGCDDGGPDRGAIWVLFMQRDGNVRSAAKISATSGGLVGPLDDGDRFGRGLGSLGDLDCDGSADLVVGATGDDDGGTGVHANRGAAWILFLKPDGTVRAERKISATSGGFTGDLADLDVFGSAVRGVHDIDGDGVRDLAVGAIGDDDGGVDHGALWLLRLRRAPEAGIGTPYCCPAAQNSSSQSARITALGSSVVADADLTLLAQALPANRFAYFVASESQAFVPGAGGSQGNLCLAQPLGRFASSIQNSGPTGTISIPVDLASIPLLGAVSPGDTFNFQCWYRDSNPMSTSNFSDAVSIAFQ